MDTRRPGITEEQGSSLYQPAFVRSAAPDMISGKHGLDVDDMDIEDEQEAKKSRIGDHDVIDGHRSSLQWDVPTDEFIEDMEVDEASLARPRRGAKRMASLTEDEGFESSRAIGRDKRARKDHDPIAKATRGKKRDRAEAGSTFGGEDSVVDDDEGDKPRAHRRRRLGNRRSATDLRGRKRIREQDILKNDEETDSPSKRAARHKRGKRSPREGDLASDDGMISHDPLCKGRRIGEEWESNGVKYKVGPNGQRLREALVKKSRSRYHMVCTSFLLSGRVTYYVIAKGLRTS